MNARRAVALVVVLALALAVAGRTVGRAGAQTKPEGKMAAPHEELRLKKP